MSVSVTTMEEQDLNPGLQILKRLESAMERSTSSHGDDISPQERIKEQYSLMVELGAVLKTSGDRSRVMEQRNKNLLNENQELYAKNAKNKERLSQYHKKVRSLQESVLRNDVIQKEFEGVIKKNDALQKEYETLVKEKDSIQTDYEALIKNHEVTDKKYELALMQKLDITKEYEEMICKYEIILKENDDLMKQLSEGNSVGKVQGIVIKEMIESSTSTDDLVGYAHKSTEACGESVCVKCEADQTTDANTDVVILSRSEMDHLEEGMQALKACIKQREKTWSKLEKKERTQRGRISRLESEVLSLKEMGNIARQELENKAAELREKQALVKQGQKEIASLKKVIVKQDRHIDKPFRSRGNSYDEPKSPVPTIIGIIEDGDISTASLDLSYKTKNKAATGPKTEIIATPLLEKKNKSTVAVPKVGGSDPPLGLTYMKNKSAAAVPKTGGSAELPLYRRNNRLALLAPTSAKAATSSSLRETPGKMSLSSATARKSAIPRSIGARRPWVEGAGNRGPLKRATTSSAQTPQSIASENIL